MHMVVVSAFCRWQVLGETLSSFWKNCWVWEASLCIALLVQRRQSTREFEPRCRGLCGEGSWPSADGVWSEGKQIVLGSPLPTAGQSGASTPVAATAHYSKLTSRL